MRELLKSGVRVVALAVISPLLVWHAILVALIGRDRAVEDTSQIVALAPGLLGQYLRRALLSCTLAECDPSCVIGFGTVISSASARIGARAYIGPFCTLGFVHVEDDVLIAAGVHVPSGPRTHGITGEGPARDEDGTPRCVTIARGAWIGNSAVVMADVGENSIVGAGSVVTRPLPSSVIAAGVPARVLRSRQPMMVGA